jgi:transcriptional regulator with XRE-family HTH domain
MPGKIHPTASQIAMYGHIRSNLDDLLKSRGWTGRDLNEHLGLRRETANTYTWLNGTKAPSPRNREKLAKLSGLAPSEFAPREPSTYAETEGRVKRPYRRRIREVEEQVAVAVDPNPVSMSISMSSPPPLPPGEPEVLLFSVNKDGTARIRLDVTLSTYDALPLVRLLMDAEAVKGYSHRDKSGSGNGALMHSHPQPSHSHTHTGEPSSGIILTDDEVGEERRG